MQTKTRLYVWIKTTDSNGEIAKNSTDIVSVEIHTQETSWSFPDDYDFSINKDLSTPVSYVVEDARPDKIMNGVDFDIIDIDSAYTLQNVLSNLLVRYAPDGIDRSFKLVYISPNSYPYYNIDDNTIVSLMSTFRKIDLSLAGNTINLPQKNVQLSSYLILRNAAVYVPASPILIIDGYESYSCVYSSDQDTAIVVMTVSMMFIMNGSSISDNINFNIQSKSNKQIQWSKCECSITSLTTISGILSDKPKKSLLSISNFNIVNISGVNSNIGNPYQSLFKIDKCVTVNVGDIINIPSIQRRIVLINCIDCAKSTFDNIEDNSISGYSIGISSEKLCDVTISNSTINSCGILNISSIEINSLTIDNIIENKNPSVSSKLLTANKIFINKSTMDISFMNAKEISLLDISGSIITGSATLSQMYDLVIKDSEIDVSSLTISLISTPDGSESNISIDNSVISGYFYITGYSDSNNNRYTNMSVGNMSRIVGLFLASNMKLFSFEEAKIQSPNVSIESFTIGTSYLDVDTSVTQKISIKSPSIHLFQPSIFRTQNPFELSISNAVTGNIAISLRDTADCTQQNFKISLNNCSIPVTFYNEALQYNGNVILTSSGSEGSSFNRNDQNVKNMLSYKIDSLCSDFSLYRLKSSNLNPSSVVFFDN